jgi:uncharacterized damage-inducible protein DinB
MSETAQQYTQRLLSYTEGQDPLAVQRSTPDKLAAVIKSLDRNQLSARPEPGRWSIAEILAHLADTELVISWRIRQTLSSNGTTIQAYDQDVWAKTFKYEDRDPQASLNTFRMLRDNNLALLNTVPKDLLENYGLHQERGKEPVTHVIRMVAGHDVNHLQQIERIVKGPRAS